MNRFDRRSNRFINFRVELLFYRNFCYFWAKNRMISQTSFEVKFSPLKNSAKIETKGSVRNSACDGTGRVTGARTYHSN